MIIKRDTLYKILLATLLIAPPLIFSIEVNIVLLVMVSLIVLFNLNYRYSKELIKLILPLVLILIIAIFSSFFFPSTLYDTIKDFFFLVKPILYILIGYYLVKGIKNKRFLFSIIIYAAFFFAIVHIYLTIYYLNNYEFDVNQLRNYAGRGNALEIFALVLMFSKKGKELYQFTGKYRNLFKAVLIISFFCYLSRTVTVSVILLILSINGYLAITRRGIIYMFGFFTSVLLFYVYLFSVDLERGASGIEGFLYKIKIAPSEIFDSEINVVDHSDLWDHWRAYEAKKALEQLNDTPLSMGLFVGKGVGSLVDLEFVSPLTEEGIQYITTLHNGYSYISFKSGFIGLLAFLLFLLMLYTQVYINSKTNEVRIINNLLSGIAVYYMFTTLIVTGLYNPRDFGGLIIGGLLSLKFYYKMENEDKILSANSSNAN